MSETPPPIPPLGLPNDPAPQKSGPPVNPGADAQYHRIADKVGLIPNVRKKDNLYQGICVLGFLLVGMVLGGFWDGAQIRDFIGDGLMIRIIVGGVVGLVVGALLSGLVIMVLGLSRKS